MKKIYALVFATSVFCLFSLTGRAQTILISWDMNGIDVDTNYAPAPYSLNGIAGTSDITGGSLSLSSSVNPSTYNNEYGFKITGSAETTSLADAIAANHYLQFTITAAAGHVFNLTSIDMNGQSDSTGAANVALLSSIDGFSAGSQIAERSGANVTGGFDTDSSGFGSSISLSGTKYDSLSSVTFRIYGWNSTSGSGATYIRNLSGNDLVIKGTTALAAVPESSTYTAIMGAMALAGVVFVKRRKCHIV